MRAAYAGFCIRVRRSSDNTERNIGFVGNVIDTVDLLAFVGAGDGFVVRKHDHSVNGFDATQATAANQPRIVSAGVLDVQNGKASLVSTGGRHLGVTSWGTVSQPFTRCYVITDNGGSTGHLVNSFSGTPNTADFVQLANIIALFAGSTSPSTSLPLIPTVFVNTFNAAASSISKNGVLTTGNSGANAFAGISLFAQNSSGATPWNGSMAEFIAFTSALSTADRQLLERDQGTYYGITVA